jgi:hypothetical protein
MPEALMTDDQIQIIQLLTPVALLRDMLGLNLVRGQVGYYASALVANGAGDRGG